MSDNESPRLSEGFGEARDFYFRPPSIYTADRINIEYIVSP